MRVASRHDIWSKIRRASAISSDVNCEKSFLRRASRALKMRTSSGGASISSQSLLVIGLVCPFDREDRPLLLRLSSRGRLLLFLVRPRCGREIGGVCLAGHQVGVGTVIDLVEQLSPEPAELGIEDGDMLGAGDDGRPRRPIEVLAAARIDRADRLDQAHHLPAAERQTGVAQAPAQGQQIGQNRRFETSSVRGRTGRPKPSFVRMLSGLVPGFGANASGLAGCDTECSRKELAGQVAADLVDVFLVLEDDTQGVIDDLLAELDRARAPGGPGPSRASQPFLAT